MHNRIAILFFRFTYTSLLLLSLVTGFQSRSIRYHDKDVLLLRRTAELGYISPSTLARNGPFFDESLSLSSSSSSSSSSSWDNLEGDFSSAVLWEDFYRENPIEASTLEWHSSMPFDVLVDYCLTNNADISNCLMIGCGTSILPEAFLAKSNTIHLTLLDSSQSCIDILIKRYGVSNPQISFICGSALELDKTTINRHGETSMLKYDVILDKGLMDAFFCNDDWEDPIGKLLQGAKNCMKSCSSRYILVSYQLATGTQDHLIEFSKSIGLSWEFNCTGSNNRVWISVATLTEDN